MKRHYRLFIGILLGIIISVTGTVLAETLVNSEDVSYSNNVSSGTYDDVQDAIDELYKRANYLGYEYQEEILNGAYPVLGDGMIPIYLSDNGDAYYADLYTKWYSYKQKKWANAVILVDSAKDKYKTGDKIKEEDIESYFVWIPRYAYKIWDLGNYNGNIAGSTLTDTDYAHSPLQASNNARIIDVVFGTKNYFESGVGKNLNAKSLVWSQDTGQFTEPEEIAISDYLQHPGFTLGNEELNGIWVGKFENSESNSKILIKAGRNSWRYASLSTFFNSILEYNPSLNSHMLKNTEWGAVAYLSHSLYGKGSEININNNSGHKSGYSAAPNTDQSSWTGDYGTDIQTDITLPWNTTTGYLASTTGNITGIYDMSGCTWEYVAATMINNGNLLQGDKSGFTAEEITDYMKQGYIDAYSQDILASSFNKRILGDATGEMGPFYQYKDRDNTARGHSSWYADASSFINVSNPWFTRGGYFNAGIISGIFNFDKTTGEGTGGIGSRLALTGTPRIS